MNILPESLSTLIEELSSLPGIGPKSAQRLAFHLLKSPEYRTARLGQAVIQVKEGIQLCEQCFSLTASALCSVCEHPSRDRHLICVVESTLDLLALEKTGEFKGLYHVLHGKISPLDGVGPEDLKISSLVNRVSTLSAEHSVEVILALNPDLEGDTTALYLQRLLESFPSVKVTRLAHGLPSGASLEYSDPITLARAIEGRRLLS